MRVNGDRKRRIPNTTNLTFAGANGESLVIALDLQGVACATGAACSSGAVEPSHVLLAIGLSPDEARSSLRFSLGRTTTCGRNRERDPRNPVRRRALARSLATERYCGERAMNSRDTAVNDTTNDTNRARRDNEIPVAVAMSGGVDSSTVAAMLRETGAADRRPDHAALESAPLAATSGRRPGAASLLLDRRCV